MLLPIAPPQITTKIGNRNRIADLVSGEEINIIKSPALTQIAFSFLLPAQVYPFAVYDGGFKKPDYYLSKLRNMKKSCKPFRLHIIRNNTASTSLKVTLENYEIIEDADKTGADIIVNITLKEYRNCSAVKTSLKSGVTRKIIPDNKEISSPKFHVVKKGDCLWEIAQKYFGNGNDFKEIYNANKDMIDKRNSGTGYPIYTIYPGQRLIIKKGGNT